MGDSISAERRSAAWIVGIWFCLSLFLLPLPLSGEQPARLAAQAARAKYGMVVSNSGAASRVGRDVLMQGGNAVDAAVATAFALAVSWPEAGNIGGGGFMLVYPVDGRPPQCVEYRETAPAAATATMFSRGESTYTCKAVGTPGTVRGLELAHRHYGKLPWKQLLTPAIELARQGVEVDEWLAHSTNEVLSQSEVMSSQRYAELRRVYGHPEGRVWRVGDRLIQPDLASTLERIAERGSSGFYEGEVATRIVAAMESGGGLITLDDLRTYEAKLRKPIHGRYRGFDLYGPPPPSSGGICVVEALNILEPFEMRRHPRFGARNLHLMAEAMRRVFCDRARHLGDADFFDIPGRLLTPDYAAELRKGIVPDRATGSDTLAPEIALAAEGSDTTHFSVIDRDGMAVSNTYTLEASWGSRIVVHGSGFLLNNEMGDFNWLPGETDRTGRIGTPPNVIEPRKRMLSSQAPFIVSRENRVVLLTGSPGGRTIINTVLCNLLNVLEFEMPLDAAIDAPRMHHQWFPDELRVEEATDLRIAPALDQLRDWGHKIVTRDRQGSAHSIQVDEATGEFIGVADGRRGGLAAGCDKP